MAITLTLRGAMAFEVDDGDGHTFLLDARPELGGEHSGLSPMEGLLAAAAGCTAMDVIAILRKMRQDVTTYRVEASGSKQAEHPRVYSDLTFSHQFTGTLSPESAARAIELSITRYCPVNAMLRATAPVTCRYSVNGVEGKAMEFPATHIPVAGSGC